MNTEVNPESWSLGLRMNELAPSGSCETCYSAMFGLETGLVSKRQRSEVEVLKKVRMVSLRRFGHVLTGRSGDVGRRMLDMELLTRGKKVSVLC